MNSPSEIKLKGRKVAGVYFNDDSKQIVASWMGASEPSSQVSADDDIDNLIRKEMMSSQIISGSAKPKQSAVSTISGGFASDDLERRLLNKKKRQRKEPDISNDITPQISSVFEESLSRLDMISSKKRMLPTQPKLPIPTAPGRDKRTPQNNSPLNKTAHSIYQPSQDIMPSNNNGEDDGVKLRRKTKTRSKQKNIRRDNRVDKPAHLLPGSKEYRGRPLTDETKKRLATGIVTSTEV